MREAVEIKLREGRMAKTERGGGKKGSRKKTRRKSGEKTEKAKKGKNNRCKESSRRVGDLG